MKNIEQEIDKGGVLTVTKKDCGRTYISAHMIRPDGTDICGMGLTVHDALEYLDGDILAEQGLRITEPTR